MARPKPARLSEGLERLERKLAVYANGYPPSSRTAALAILTGNGEAAASTEAYMGATYRATLRLLSSEDAPSTYVATALRPHVAPRRDYPHRQRFHIEMSRPPRRRERAMRSAIAAVVVLAIVAAAGLEVRLLTRVNEPIQIPTPRVVGEAARATPAETAVAIATPDNDASINQPVASAEPVSSPTAPAPAFPVPATQMELLLDEHFSSNAESWPDDPTRTAWMANGTYWLAPRQASHFVAVSIPGARDLGDTVVSAWFHKVGGPQGGGYGLILRDQSPDPLDGENQVGRYYVFEAGDRGQFGVWLRDGDHWVDLLTWTPSETVNRGTAANEMTVTAIGDQLSFLINGTPVATQTDTLLHKGAAGVFVGGDDNQVALDRLTVRVPR